MSFFEQQEDARRQTRRLIWLFVLAVIAIVLAVNVAMTLLWAWLHGTAQGMQHVTYPPAFFLTNTLVTLMLIVGGTMIELFNLRDGGDAVARMAGGRLVATDTRDALERRLLNVVEEMALASGIACPKAYVLDRESSINAFAAGYNANEAVIAVTQGTLQRLSRDELQGVVAHEFSHILNGDMRLNVRLIGVLFGIQMVAGFGQQMMRIGARTSVIAAPRRRDNNGVPVQLFIMAAGAALFAIGYIGIVFGRLIKSAVSRQREFLADASAVQFTRNPDGIGQALRKIGGLVREGGEASRIMHGNAEHLSHLFLSAVRPGLLDGWFATHPSLSERLRRIYGRHVAMMEAPVIETPVDPMPVAEALPDLPYAALAPRDVTVRDAQQEAAAEIVAAAHQGKREQPIVEIRRHPLIERAVHEPYTAILLVLALFAEADGMLREPQQAVLQRQVPKQFDSVMEMIVAIRSLSPVTRFPLLDLAIPTLRRLPVNAHMRMLDDVAQLVASDQRVSLQEMAMQLVLMRRLDGHASRAVPVRFHDLHELRSECLILLSLVAHATASRQRVAAEEALLRATTAIPGVAFTAAELVPRHALGQKEIKRVLERSNQLAPLTKPILVKAMLAVAGTESPLALPLADLLRALCAALDVPMPNAVAAVYAEAGWQAL
ncbi:M48 family metallopeptidase [uncultured Oxalicibacterium sp.]|uniref:M48 family metallopeptidase n=1 Tax=uncultured Oxalicibacterium sp. TaxID=1168540 RepID=UPI0025FB15DB|nr:M48 family metallopeptidase [uncultured Oxalicibacterium sp.]